MTEEPGRPSAAATAADKVHAIVDAAERSAQELEAAAREEAGRIRDEARRETEEQLARVQQASDRLSARAGEIEAALEDLAGRVREAIAGLREELGELRSQAGRQAAATPEPRAGVEAERGPAPEAVPEAHPETEPGDAPEESEPLAATEPAAAQPTPGNEGARVIALNMALNGAPREQTARYLAENFELSDVDALLDDVYARAGS